MRRTDVVGPPIINLQAAATLSIQFVVDGSKRLSALGFSEYILCFGTDWGYVMRDVTRTLPQLQALLSTRAI